jgi:hypothetical protein
MYSGSHFQVAEGISDHSTGKHLDYEQAMVQGLPE